MGGVGFSLAGGGRRRNFEAPLCLRIGGACCGPSNTATLRTTEMDDRAVKRENPMKRTTIMGLWPVAGASVLRVRYFRRLDFGLVFAR